MEQGVDITIPVTCSVFEPDPMTSQCTRGVPRLKFGHNKIHEMWVFFSFVAIASQKLYRRVAKHHCCFISHGATPGADDVTGQSDLGGWPYLYYRALGMEESGPHKQSTLRNKEVPKINAPHKPRDVTRPTVMVKRYGFRGTLSIKYKINSLNNPITASVLV